MGRRDQQIYDEASALWRAMFDEPPPVQADGGALLDLITARLGEATYDRLRSPFLRPSTIVGPAQPRDARSLS